MGRKQEYPWFRLYSEARTDAKLRTLTDRQHRVWFHLLCLASEQAERGVIADLDEELLAIEVADGDVEVLRDTLARLERLRILTRHDDGAFAFTAWLERQYDKPSDTPQETARRKAESRARHAQSPNQHTMSRRVTPSHAESHDREDGDGETEREREDIAAALPVREDVRAHTRETSAERATPVTPVTPVTDAAAASPAEGKKQAILAALRADAVERFPLLAAVPTRDLDALLRKHLRRGLTAEDLHDQFARLAASPSRNGHAPDYARLASWLQYAKHTESPQPGRGGGSTSRYASTPRPEPPAPRLTRFDAVPPLASEPPREGATPDPTPPSAAAPPRPTRTPTAARHTPRTRGEPPDAPGDTARDTARDTAGTGSALIERRVPYLVPLVAASG